MDCADRAARLRRDAALRPDLARRSLELARIYERAAERKRQLTLPDIIIIEK